MLLTGVSLKRFANFPHDGDVGEGEGAGDGDGGEVGGEVEGDGGEEEDFDDAGAEVDCDDGEEEDNRGFADSGNDGGDLEVGGCEEEGEEEEEVASTCRLLQYNRHTGDEWGGYKDVVKGRYKGKEEKKAGGEGDNLQYCAILEGTRCICFTCNHNSFSAENASRIVVAFATC